MLDQLHKLSDTFQSNILTEFELSEHTFEQNIIEVKVKFSRQAASHFVAALKCYK